jgi:hypothetical protein
METYSQMKAFIILATFWTQNVDFFRIKKDFCLYDEGIITHTPNNLRKMILCFGSLV